MSSDNPMAFERLKAKQVVGIQVNKSRRTLSTTPDQSPKAPCL
jgi:hypothetical protein